MSLHRELIDQVINDPQTPADFAVRREILELRAQIAELKKPKRKVRANRKGATDGDTREATK